MDFEPTFHRKDEDKSKEELVDDLKRLRDSNSRLKVFIEKYKKEDITERKQPKEALWANRANLQALLDAANESIFLMEPDGTIIAINHCTAQRLGSTPEELVGKNMFDRLSPELAEHRRACMKDVLHTGKPARWEDERDDRIIDNSVYPVFSADGKVVRLAIFGRDVTDERRAIQALRESEEKFRKFFDIPLIGSAITSPEKRFIQVNDKLCEMFGYSREELLKTSWDKITYPGDLDINLNAFNRLIAGEIDIFTFEKRFIHKNGGLVYVILSVQCIRREEGTVDYLISNYNDITIRKHAEIALQEAKDQAEIYLDLMGHDINNMNQIAIGFLGLAQDASTLEDAKNLISKPLESLHNSSKLIENVTKLQKSNHTSLKHHVINLCDVLQKLQKRYSTVPGRDIIIDFAPTPGCLVIANELLEDIFSNLISNSIKHSETDKPLTIGLGVNIVGEAGNRYYKVIVEDNGPGIPNPLKGKLFLRLHSGKTKVSGMGLGLYLVKTLVDDFKGKVRVEDRIPGDYTQGVRFEVLIPALE